MTYSRFIPHLLTSGGDRRIIVPRAGNTNTYGASPFPRSTLGYAASTANDISFDAFRHLETTVSGWTPGRLQGAGEYADLLEQMRARLRRAWDLAADTAIVFAASGTDLEYVALSLAEARHGLGVTNILLGRDEVGSGCILSAAGRFFAGQSPLCAQTAKGEFVPGLEGTILADVDLRDRKGAPRSSLEIAGDLDRRAREASTRGRHPIIHVVHGSKTGLVVPVMTDLANLRAAHGENLTVVVDACQARIEGDDIRRYLALDCIVMVTGSKFMGGPPFSGMALVPSSYRPRRQLAEGLAMIFRRAEWPAGWPSCRNLPESANPGLLLRLEAALFELTRFLRVERAARDRVIRHFNMAIEGLADRLRAGIVDPFRAGDALHDGTLATLDLSQLPGRPDFNVAQRWHRVLAARGLRLGQPVKCMPGEDGRWAATLRISLSMPLISTLAGFGPTELSDKFGNDFARIADVLEAAQRPVAARPGRPAVFRSACGTIRTGFSVPGVPGSDDGSLTMHPA